MQVNYRMIEGDESQIQSGFIAQEVEKVIPEVVSTDREGWKSLDYSRLTASLTKAIQEQNKILKESYVEMESQMQTINKLENERNEMLESVNLLVSVLLSYLSLSYENY